MNKGELVAAFARAAGLSLEEARAVVEALFGSEGLLAEALARGERVQIPGFGTFEVRRRKARAGRNPRTGKTITIPPTKTPGFRAAKALKDAVHDLPTAGGGKPDAKRPSSTTAPPSPASERPRMKMEESAGPELEATAPPDAAGDHAADREEASAGTDRNERGGAKVPTVVSAEAPQELMTGEAGEVAIRIELDTQDAAPLPVSARVESSASVDFTVIVTVSGSAIELVDPWLKTLPPPATERASTGSFEIRAVAPGESMIDLKFLQAAQPVAALRLTVRAVAADASDQSADTRGLVVDVDPAAFGATAYLYLEARSRFDGNQEEMTYSYLLTAPGIGLTNEKWERSIEGGARTLLSRLHRELVERILAQRPEDETRFLQEIVAKGQGMSRLLPDDMIREIWDRRGDIGGILLHAHERRPLPWELLRMVHPDRRGAAGQDERHLAEYGLTRQLSGSMGATRLGGSHWGYMFAEYPRGSYPPVEFGRRFFDEQLAHQPNVRVSRLPSEPTGLVDALAAGDLDVIHLGCHGESDLDDADATALIVGDRKVQRDTPQGPRVSVEPVRLTPEFVRHRFDFRGRAPLVFLNACESGRRAPGLHGLEGWPDIFLSAGAGAFVGTSWSVKGEPAGAFAEAFYGSLRSGDTLAEATREARAAAQAARRDASWLSYGVYGYPTATLEPGV